jgi:hypothetical protein
MADGHARTTGALYQIATLGGKQFKLRPFSLKVLPEMEAFIISKREDPIVWATRACMVAPESQHEVIWRVAMEKSIRARAVTDQEMEEFRRTTIGGAWVFWVCARQDHPEIKSVEDALGIIESASDEELEILNAKAYVVSGEADLGNSTGLPATEGEKKAEQEGGPQSTSTSPTPTDGQTAK